MDVYVHTENQSSRRVYTDHAKASFQALDDKVRKVFEDVQAWRGWILINDPATPPEQIYTFVREMYRAICWYQPHTTEAAFAMVGRFPKREVEVMRVLAAHKAEEAEHGLWALEDLAKLGEKQIGPSSPAAFAVAAVWWRIAQHEEPLGYLGAEYLYEQLTALATKAALPIISGRKLDEDGLRFVIEHATEDAKHATFLKHQILDIVTRYPESIDAMHRCFDFFAHIWPLPVWEEALNRTEANFAAAEAATSR